MKKIMKKAIADSFMNLCSEIPINSIKVQDIINYCQISRQTFYNYFRDKYDIMNYIYLRDAEHAVEKFDNSFEGLVDTIQYAFECCLKNKRFYISIANCEIQNGFPQFFYDHTKEFYSTIILNKYGNEALTRSIEIAIEFNSYGAKNLFMDWIKTGMKGNPEFMATEIAKCMPNELKMLILE